MEAAHVLVVGGTGMLSGVCEALAAEGTRLSLLSRRASAWRGAVVEAFDCDYRDEAGFAALLTPPSHIPAPSMWRWRGFTR